MLCGADLLGIILLIGYVGILGIGPFNCFGVQRTILGPVCWQGDQEIKKIMIKVRAINFFDPGIDRVRGQAKLSYCPVPEIK